MPVVKVVVEDVDGFHKRKELQVMGMGFESSSSADVNYGTDYHPERIVYVIKKDGSKEAFNVQKVINAVGKSAYRALTKFTQEEEKQICQYVIDKVNELAQDEIPIPITCNSFLL